ncbi:paired amphipathic helix protein Sin3 [Trifolium repens]|nr:paired amphipathic helix protein Sin3 [Trifolium repens]
MKKILEGHKDLILKFNIILPDPYKIKDGNTSLKKRPNLEDAKSFLRKIRAQFQGVDDHIYKSLIAILYRYYRKVESFDAVYQEVTTLLKDHPDLLNEFIHFLPNGIASRYVAACNRVRRDSTMIARPSELVSKLTLSAACVLLFLESSFSTLEHKLGFK